MSHIGDLIIKVGPYPSSRTRELVFTAKDLNALRDELIELRGVTTHLAVRGSGLFGCCKRTPFEVPGTDRMTEDSGKATCPGRPGTAPKPPAATPEEPTPGVCPTCGQPGDWCGTGCPQLVESDSPGAGDVQ